MILFLIHITIGRISSYITAKVMMRLEDVIVTIEEVVMLMLEL